MTTKLFLAAIAVVSSSAMYSAESMQKALPTDGASLQTAQVQKQTGMIAKKRIRSLEPKKILSQEYRGGGIYSQMVETDSRFIYRRLVDANGKPIAKQTTQKVQRLETSEGDSFKEDFESWNEALGGDWIPDGWEERIAEGNDVIELEKNFNNTWHVGYTDGLGFLPRTKDGEKEAFIHFSYSSDSGTPDDPSDDRVAVDQDEWLITPAFEVGQYHDLFFSAGVDPRSCYNDEFVNWENLTYTKREVVHNLEVLVMREGKEDVEVFDFEQEIPSKLSDEDLFSEPFEYKDFRVELKEFEGQTIKLAFRYTRNSGDMQGNSVCLDAIRVGTPVTNALYDRPEGSFFVTFSHDLLALNGSYLLGPAFTNTIWNNHSHRDATSFEWKYTETEEGETKTSTERNLNATFPAGVTTTPILTAMAEGASNTEYQYGYTDKNSNFTPGILFNGGTSLFDIQGIGQTLMSVGECDPQYGISAPAFSETEYCFGTGAESYYGGLPVSIGTIFQKPAAKYLVSDIWIPFYRLTMKDPTKVEFTLILQVYNETTGMYEDLATAVCKGSDIREVEGFPIMEFNAFKIKGEELATSMLEIDNKFWVEIDGFDNPEITEWCPLNQGSNSPTGNCQSFIYLRTKDEYMTMNTFYNLSELLVDFSAPFIINMDVTYSYLVSENNDTQYYVDKNGGSKEFLLESPYIAEGVTVDDFDFPEWLSCNIADDATSGKVKLTVNVAEMPEGETTRTHTIKVSVPGTSLNITVVQNIDGSVSTVNEADISVINNGDNWTISYPGIYRTVDVVSVSGQKMASYQLPESGTFSIPSEGYSKGIYLLVFNNGKTVKLLK